MQKGKAPNKEHYHKHYHDLLFQDYFAPEPVYNANDFRHHFRMQCTLFDRILHDLRAYNDYFEWKVDALGKPGFSTEQKLTAAFQMLAYGALADQLDEFAWQSQLA